MKYRIRKTLIIITALGLMAFNTAQVIEYTGGIAGGRPAQCTTHDVPECDWALKMTDYYSAEEQ